VRARRTRGLRDCRRCPLRIAGRRPEGIRTRCQGCVSGP
jgi:hypothetical protein